jgi:multiple sugar transport system permease protein
MQLVPAEDRLWRYLTIAPALLVFLVFTALPIANLVALSLHDVTWVEGRARWTAVGWRHYLALPRDGTYLAGVRNTLVFAVSAVGCQMVLGFILALFTSKAGRGRLFYRTVFIIPILIPGIVIGAIWKLIYNFDFGVLNQLLGVLGVPPQDWLGTQRWALPSVIMVDVWHWTPFCFLLLLAGLESLPQDIYDSVKVDGANAWQELCGITLPLMVPTLTVTLLFRLIVAFKVFDEVYLLTSGGPGKATEVVSFTIYRRFFTEGREGFGAAMSLVTIFAIALVTILLLAAVRRREARS